MAACQDVLEALDWVVDTPELSNPEAVRSLFSSLVWAYKDAQGRHGD